MTGIALEEIALTSSAFEHNNQEQFKSDCRKILDLSKQWRACVVGRSLAQDTDIEAVLLRTLTITRKYAVEGKKLHDTWRPVYQNWILPTVPGNDAKEGPFKSEAEFETWKKGLLENIGGLATIMDSLRTMFLSALDPECEASREVMDNVDKIRFHIGNENSWAVSGDIATPSEDNDFGFKAVLHEAMGDYPRIVLTHNGCVGRSRSTVQERDLVCLILGCAMPMVLRPIDKHFEVVGELYMEGLLHGEAMAMVEEEGMVLQEFELR